MGNRTISTIEQDRIYDIDFINWEEAGVEGEGLLTFGERSKKTTGVIKSINRFVKFLLTDLGSDPFNRGRGTEFYNIQYMGASTEDELGTFIVLQLNTALDQVKEIQAKNNFPEDENLASVELVSIEKVSSEKARIYIKLLTESGEGAKILLPNIGG